MKIKRRRASSLQKKEYPVPFDKMDITSLRYLRKLLFFYVHPVVVCDETSQPNNPGGVKVAQERHRSEAEIRSVYTLFMKPLIQTELIDDTEKNNALFKLLNEILDVVTSILNRFKGHLRQFIVDDKGKTIGDLQFYFCTECLFLNDFHVITGVILIATFGLRGSTSPNM